MKKVEIKCQSATSIPIESLFAFQGNLKDLSKENFEKLKKQILKLGFSEPFSVWKSEDGTHHILNGHQRLRTLIELKKEGYEIPPVPISLVQADSIKQAKEKVLALTAQFGEITKQGLYEFMHESDLTTDILEDLRLPEINMDEFKLEFFDEGVTKVAPGCDEDEVPETPSEPKAKLGDLYYLDPYYECQSCGKIYPYEAGKDLAECACG